jgi:hypothetical protein
MVKQYLNMLLPMADASELILKIATNEDVVVGSHQANRRIIDLLQ